MVTQSFQDVKSHYVKKAMKLYIYILYKNAIVCNCDLQECFGNCSIVLVAKID